MIVRNANNTAAVKELTFDEVAKHFVLAKGQTVEELPNINQIKEAQLVEVDGLNPFEVREARFYAGETTCSDELGRLSIWASVLD